MSCALTFSAFIVPKTYQLQFGTGGPVFGPGHKLWLADQAQDGKRYVGFPHVEGQGLRLAFHSCAAGAAAVLPAQQIIAQLPTLMGGPTSGGGPMIGVPAPGPAVPPSQGIPRGGVFGGHPGGGPGGTGTGGGGGGGGGPPIVTITGACLGLASPFIDPTTKGLKFTTDFVPIPPLPCQGWTTPPPMELSVTVNSATPTALGLGGNCYIGTNILNLFFTQRAAIAAWLLANDPFPLYLNDAFSDLQFLGGCYIDSSPYTPGPCDDCLGEPAFEALTGQIIAARYGAPALSTYADPQPETPPPPPGYICNCEFICSSYWRTVTQGGDLSTPPAFSSAYHRVTAGSWQRLAWATYHETLSSCTFYLWATIGAIFDPVTGYTFPLILRAVGPGGPSAGTYPFTFSGTVSLHSFHTFCTADWISGVNVSLTVTAVGGSLLGAPSMSERAFSAGRALLGPRLNAEDSAARLAVCNVCPANDGGYCRDCHCGRWPLSRLDRKTRMALATCPRGLWPVLQSQPS